MLEHRVSSKGHFAISGSHFDRDLIRVFLSHPAAITAAASWATSVIAASTVRREFVSVFSRLYGPPVAHRTLYTG